MTPVFMGDIITRRWQSRKATGTGWVMQTTWAQEVPSAEVKRKPLSAVSMGIGRDVYQNHLEAVKTISCPLGLLIHLHFRHTYQVRHISAVPLTTTVFKMRMSLLYGNIVTAAHQGLLVPKAADGHCTGVELPHPTLNFLADLSQSALEHHGHAA